MFWDFLVFVCSSLQIAGFILMVYMFTIKYSRKINIIIIIAGLSSVVKLFLPVESTRNPLGYTAALTGIAIAYIYYKILKENSKKNED